MTRFLDGNELELAWQNRLGTICEILPDDLRLDIRYKLDIMVHKFKGVDKVTPIGLQLTTRRHDAIKQDIFLRVQEESSVVPKAAYIEIYPKVDIKQGAATVVSSALMSFIFDRKYQSQKVIGIRIYADLTYEFFSLRENIKMLKRKQREQNCEYSMKGPMSGLIVDFLTIKSYGFIKPTENGGGNFFFHISKADEEVSSHLRMIAEKQNNKRGMLRVSIPVTFEYGGTRPNEEYPEAINVKLCNPFPEPKQE